MKKPSMPDIVRMITGLVGLTEPRRLARGRYVGLQRNFSYEEIAAVPAYIGSQGPERVHEAKIEESLKGQRQSAALQRGGTQAQ